MIARIYSVKDELTGKFHNPMFFPDSETTTQEITRLFKTQVNNTTLWKENPEDFSLWCIGSFDDISGVFANEMTKIAGGRSVKDVGAED